MNWCPTRKKKTTTLAGSESNHRTTKANKIFPKNGHSLFKSRSAEAWITRFPVLVYKSHRKGLKIARLPAQICLARCCIMHKPTVRGVWKTRKSGSGGGNENGNGQMRECFKLGSMIGINSPPPFSVFVARWMMIRGALSRKGTSTNEYKLSLG